MKQELYPGLKKVYSSVKIPSQYDGIVATFDLDKTYLATEFETLAGLMKIPFEKAKDKKNIPGAVSLVKEVRKGGYKSKAYCPIFFISGSPKSMEKVIRDKFALDEVIVDGILFKDFATALKKLQFKKIKAKIGYKLGTLIYARSVFPIKTDEILFGDDSEYDATIYSLYSDYISGRLKGFELLTILKKWETPEDEMEMIEYSMSLLKKSGWYARDAVRRIFIHMETGSLPDDYSHLSKKVTPTYSYFQTALILYRMNLITREGVFRIISDIVKDQTFSIPKHTDSLNDLIRRDLIEPKEAKKFLKVLVKKNPLALPANYIYTMKNDFLKWVDNVSKIQKIIESVNDPNRDLTLVERYMMNRPTSRV